MNVVLCVLCALLSLCVGESAALNSHTFFVQARVADDVSEENTLATEIAENAVVVRRRDFNPSRAQETNGFADLLQVHSAIVSTNLDDISIDGLSNSSLTITSYSYNLFNFTWISMEDFACNGMLSSYLANETYSMKQQLFFNGSTTMPENVKVYQKFSDDLGRLNLHFNITYPTIADIGTYTCCETALFQNGSRTAAYCVPTRVVIEEANDFLVSSDAMRFAVNLQRRLTFNMGFHESDSVTCNINGQPLPGNSYVNNASELVIKSATYVNMGAYECQAKNTAALAHRSFIIVASLERVYPWNGTAVVPPAQPTHALPTGIPSDTSSFSTVFTVFLSSLVFTTF